jgi:hypothetical protein
MHHLFRHRPSPAMVVALIALFVALGGGAYAAVKLPKNSVSSKQIKKGAVKNSDLAANAVTGGKVKAGSLDSSDFKAGTLLQGPPGTPGANGKDGVNGAATVVYRTFLANSAGSNSLGEAGATCDAGERLIGGGGGWVNNANPPTSYELSGTVSDNGPATSGDAPIAEGDTPDEWHVSGKNTTGVTARMFAYAVCAKP